MYGIKKYVYSTLTVIFLLLPLWSSLTYISAEVTSFSVRMICLMVFMGFLIEFTILFIHFLLVEGASKAERLKFCVMHEYLAAFCTTFLLLIPIGLEPVSIPALLGSIVIIGVGFNVFRFLFFQMFYTFPETLLHLTPIENTEYAWLTQHAYQISKKYGISPPKVFFINVDAGFKAKAFRSFKTGNVFLNRRFPNRRSDETVREVHS